MYDYYEHIKELIDINPEEAIDSLERHEKNLSHNPIDLHFAYNSMIKIYYRKRKNKLLLNKCIEACKKDIKLFPTFKEAYIKDDLNRLHNLLASYNSMELDKEAAMIEKDIQNYKFPNIRIPSFKRLAIIYEKNKEYNKAIEVCNLALQYKLEDGTKGGFEGRIEKLKRKIKSPPPPSKPISTKTKEKHKKLTLSSKN